MEPQITPGRLYKGAPEAIVENWFQFSGDIWFSAGAVLELGYLRDRDKVHILTLVNRAGIAVTGTDDKAYSIKGDTKYLDAVLNVVVQEANLGNFGRIRESEYLRLTLVGMNLIACSIEYPGGVLP